MANLPWADLIPSSSLPVKIVRSSPTTSRTRCVRRFPADVVLEIYALTRPALAELARSKVSSCASAGSFGVRERALASSADCSPASSARASARRLQLNEIPRPVVAERVERGRRDSRGATASTRHPRSIVRDPSRPAGARRFGTRMWALTAGIQPRVVHSCCERVALPVVPEIRRLLRLSFDMSICALLFGARKLADFVRKSVPSRACRAARRPFSAKKVFVSGATHGALRLCRKRAHSSMPQPFPREEHRRAGFARVELAVVRRSSGAPERR